VIPVVKKIFTTGITGVHGGKFEKSLTPDYMHLNASAASAEMD